MGLCRRTSGGRSSGREYILYLNDPYLIPECPYVGKGSGGWTERRMSRGE